jgi:hypothetical protein
MAAAPPLAQRPYDPNCLLDRFAQTPKARRGFVATRHIDAPKTYKGLPREVKTATQEVVLEWMMRTFGEDAAAAKERFKRLDGFRIIADDPGDIYVHAFVVVHRRADGLLVFDRLLQTPHKDQERTRAFERTRQARAAQLAETAGLDKADEGYEVRRAGLAAVDAGVANLKFREAKAKQQDMGHAIDQLLDLVALVGQDRDPMSPLKTPGQADDNVKMPCIVVIGDGGGGGASKRGSTTAVNGNAFLRKLYSEAAGRNLEMLFVRQDEFRTTVNCQEHACRTTTPTTRDMKHPRRIVDNAEVGRQLQCEVCRVVYNRDLSAAHKIFYAFWHTIVWGKSPFRPPRP